MAHYSMLRSYRFGDDVDDIRGTVLYGAWNERIGKMDDVVFDHQTGDIRYVVVDVGDGRKVLLPPDHMYRCVFDQDSFGTNLSQAEVDRLPAFDENMLASQKKWARHENVHKDAWHKQDQEAEKEYRTSYRDDPVAHRQGSNHFVTPEPSEIPPHTGTEEERVITGADLTPHRLTDKFNLPSHPMFGGTAEVAEGRSTMSISRAANYGSEDPAPRWTDFQENLRRSAGRIRGACPTCSRESKVA